MEQIPVNRISDLDNGDYTILEYEPIRTRYGRRYILTAIKDNMEENRFKIFSNSYLTKYIDIYEPDQKIKIIVNNKSITVPGYVMKKILK